jgi:hypothetical protein
MPEIASRSPQAGDRVAFWVLVVLTASALVIGTWARLSNLGAGSLWLDELWTLDAISRTFKEMVGARLVSDQHPPLWNSLAWVWLRVAGTYDAATMRILPLAFSLVAMGAPLVGAIRFRSLRPALLVMAALIALSLFPLQYAVEFRSYSMLLAFGTVATIVWAGLLVGELPSSGPWIFTFCLAGALAGFTHYYGHLLYLGELLVLLVGWLLQRTRRPLGALLGWAALSLVPVSAWYVLTRQWFPVRPVAAEPSVDIVRTWLAYGLSPVSTLAAGHVPGYAYPDVAGRSELILAGLVVVVIAVAIALRVRSRRSADPPALDGDASMADRGAALLVAAASLIVLALGVGGAWVGSLVLPPSMNYRNLAALLPVLFLAIACAATPGRADRVNHLTGAGVVAAWMFASVTFVGRYGVESFVPPWQAQSGYRTAVETLVAFARDEPSTQLVGLDLPWGWHGQWDAAIRAQLAAPPADSGDGVPLDVRWILDVQELQASGPSGGPLIVFSDSTDQRSGDLFAWVEATRGGCERSVVGGPGYGGVEMLACPPVDAAGG